MRTRLALLFVLVALAVGSCGTGSGMAVGDGEYTARVPTLEQLAAPAAEDIPGGFVVLRADGTNQVELTIGGDEVTFRLDGVVTASRTVTERITVIDSEGSGPLKGQRQVLVLGASDLTLGSLVIEQPAIWPGSFDESPVITVKPWNTQERGPVVSCAANEDCLLLSRGVDPIGRYANANNPELGENPITSITISADRIEFLLESGNKTQTVTTDRVDEFSTACGLSTSQMWDIPEAIDLAFEDPVLIHTPCPSVPGAAVRLVIMERSAIPVLAQLTEATDGAWCQAGPACLWFVPE